MRKTYHIPAPDLMPPEEDWTKHPVEGDTTQYFDAWDQNEQPDIYLEEI